MRILWIKTEHLHPLDKGGRIRTYHMLRALKAKHHVTYLCLDDGTGGAAAREKSREYAHELIEVPFSPPPKRTARYFLDLFANLFSSWPYALSRYASPGLRQKTRELSGRADLVVCDFLMPSISIDDADKTRAVLFQHNVEAMIWKRHTDVARNILLRTYMRLQWKRMQRSEGRECCQYSHVVAVSEGDVANLRAEYGLGSVSSVSTGVDLEYFSPSGKIARTANEIVFVGSMDWMPNAEGIRWFASEVFELVRQRLPDARLTIVGRSPTAAVRNLARDPSIVVTGTVDDVRPYLERAAVNVVPLRVGGGTRLKIFEAMGLGAPTVSTTIGAEGLPLKHGEHLLLADTPEALADAVIELLKRPEEGKRLADSAQAYVRGHCSWSRVAEDFVAQCIDGRGLVDAKVSKPKAARSLSV